MAGPAVFELAQVKGAGFGLAKDEAEEKNLLDVAALRDLARRVEAAGGVDKLDNRQFGISGMGNFTPAERQLVIASAARANVDPLAQAEVTGAGLEDYADKIREVGDQLGAAKAVKDALKTLVEGTTFDVRWNGPQVTLTEAAAKGLVTLLTLDARAIIAALAVSIPKLAAIMAIVSACGNVLAKWIELENGTPGVTLELLFWIVPWVDVAAA